MAKASSNGKHVPFEVHNERFGGFIDPIAATLMRNQLTTNLDRTWSRSWADNVMDPRRSIEDECGYPALNKLIPIDTYVQLYERDPIAARVVEVLPKQTFQVNPQVYEDEASDVNTPFEQDWDDLGNELRGGEMNWFQDEEGSPIWSYMKRLDVLSGIGSYGVMMLGFDDVGTDWKLTNPVKMLKEEGSIPANSKQEMAANYERALKDGKFRPYRLVRNAEVESVFGGQDDDIEDVSATKFKQNGPQPGGESKKRVRLTHIRVFGEPLAQAVQFESNPTSPRFGQPTMYSLTLNDMRDQHGGVGMTASTYQVHWTRVIHYCDQDHQASSSEIFAPPRMRASLNILLGLRKIYHGDPEGYWKACVTLLSYETHPQLGGDVDVDISSLRDMDEKMMNGLQRSAFLTGMTLKPVAPTVSDPTPHIAVGIEAICIKIPCPVRVFKGSERGELASSQDDSQWNDTVAGRQRNTTTPGIIVPFINRLIAVGALSRPTVGKKPKFKPKPKMDAQQPPGPGGPPQQGGGFGGNSKPAMFAGKGSGSKPPFGGARNAFDEDVAKEFNKMREGGDENVPPQGKLGTPKAEKPRGGFTVDWPDLNSLSDQEKATVGAAKTTALAAYIQGGCSALVPEHDYLTHYQGFTDEEADAMLEQAAALEEEKMELQAQQAEELGFGLEAPEGMVDPEQRDMDHEVEMERAKHGNDNGFPFGKGGPPKPGAGKPPFVKNTDDTVDNTFCATGEGGGVDPSCSGGSGGGAKPDVNDPAGTASKFNGIMNDTQQKLRDGTMTETEAKARVGKAVDAVTTSTTVQTRRILADVKQGMIEKGEGHNYKYVREEVMGSLEQAHEALSERAKQPLDQSGKSDRKSNAADVDNALKNLSKNLVWARYRADMVSKDDWEKARTENTTTEVDE